MKDEAQITAEIARSLGLTPDGLKLVQERIKAEKQLTALELEAARRCGMTLERYLSRRTPPRMTPAELKAEQVAVMRKVSMASPFSEADRAKILLAADEFEKASLDGA